MYDELIGKLQWLRQSFLDGNSDGGEIEEKFDRVILVAETLQRNDSAWQRNVKEAWAALRLIRDVVETLGPVGALASVEHTACTPGEKGHFIREAEELVKGIRKIAGLRDKIISGEKPLSEGKIKRGGVNPPITEPKPPIKPPAQRPAEKKP